MILENDTITEIIKDTGWLLKGKSIIKTFKFEAFMEAISFVNAVADLAEEVNHHPDIEILYTRVKINLSTHSEGGVTDKDISLSVAIDEVV